MNISTFNILFWDSSLPLVARNDKQCVIPKEFAKQTTEESLKGWLEKRLIYPK
jgi:hypothetical protein